MMEMTPSGEKIMIHRQLPIDQLAPWLVSGASGCYVLARARQLSRAKASRAPWPRFLARQSDVILMLCGSPAVWHFVRRRHAALRQARAVDDDQAILAAGAIHRLRQVFTVLLLGLGMIARKAAHSSPADLAALAVRLQNVARTGARILSALDEPPAALVPAGAVAYPIPAPGGNQRS